MKKLFLCLFFIICLTGCNSSKPTSVSVDTIPSATQEARKIVFTKDTDKYNSMNLYQDCEYSITGAEDEKIELLTDAARDDNNDFLWDDSQTWVLIVKNKDGIYPLYSEYSHAMPSVNVSEYYIQNETIPVIRLLIPSGASFEIREYRFDDNSFTEEIPYSTGAINELPINQY